MLVDKLNKESLSELDKDMVIKALAHISQFGTLFDTNSTKQEEPKLAVVSKVYQ